VRRCALDLCLMPTPRSLRRVSARQRLLLPLAALTLGIRLAIAAEPASLSVLLFDGDTPLPRAEVLIDDTPLGRTDGDGALRLSVPAGNHRLSIRRGDAEVAALDLQLAEHEDAELIATLYPDAAPSLFLDSALKHGGAVAQTPTSAGPPGVLSGRIVSIEDGKPVAGARVFISGTPLDVISDGNGEFSAELVAGSYSLSILAPGFAAQTLDGIVITGEQSTVRDLQLAPAGMELPEYVVLEPFVEGSLAAFVEERRNSGAVTDILGAEQIARAGDSDAAGALKRVTGLTLVDGKFIFVRGLGERYSSVLLNGAQIPSPDPTRRVIPLDLFPTEILQGVVVQKTFSADMPGEFGGGTIQLRTKGFPDEPLFKVALGAGWVDGTTGKQGLREFGSGSDISGFDDGRRALPEVLEDLRQRGIFLRQRTPANPNGLTPSELEAVGEDLASGRYDIKRQSIGPDSNFALAGGNSWQFTDRWKAGFLASFRHSQSWDSSDEIRREFQASSAGLALRNDLDVQRSIREVDASGFLVAGIDYGDNHKLRVTNMIVRQTENEARISTGTQTSQDVERSLIEWIENELKSRQISGEHRFPIVGELPVLEGASFDWLYTFAKAGRFAPFTREYRFDIQDDGRRLFSLNNDSNTTSFADLNDSRHTWDIGAHLPFRFSDAINGELGVQVNRVNRSRDSFVRRFFFVAGGRDARDPDLLALDSLDAILNADSIGPTGFRLTEITQPSDTYFAEQRLDAEGYTLNLSLWQTVNLNLGIRNERNLQNVTTFSVLRPNDPPVVALLDTTDHLPSLAATWLISDKQQLRLAYSETLSRPDFRELSTSTFIDPLLDIVTFGNPDLKPTAITHYDARWEYYFSPTESVSLALFRKDFTQPIEKQLVPGGGSLLLTLENAESATNQGVEVDGYTQLGFVNGWAQGSKALQWLGVDTIDWDQWNIAANYAYIESDIVLDPLKSNFNTNLNRALEGQSSYIVNLQLGYQSGDGQREANLLFNTSGKRIVQVGVDGLPDVFEQPFGQLDFTFKQRLGDDWSVRLKLRNLLDPKVEFTQGSETTRAFRKGREIALSFEWSPF